MRAYWFDIKNFGDSLNPYLIGKISGHKVIHYPFLSTQFGSKEYHLVCGSIFFASSPRAIIWGAGLISEKQWIRKAKKILAVRGPLTRKKILEHGYDCPEIYGDPALLLPVYYKVPFRKNKYEIGIIPHYVDFKKVKRKLRDEKVNVINICDSVENVIYEIVSCERTISSSLHGLIVSHAYRVPSLWAEFSNRVIGKGFKFKDYLLSVNLDIYDPLDLKYTIPNRYELLKYFENKRFDIKIDLELLLSVCPFREEKN